MSGLSFESLADLSPQLRERLAPTILAMEQAKALRAAQKTVNGIRFNNLRQARRYKLLLAAQEQDMILDLQLWRQVTIRDKFTMTNGQTKPAVRFVADFAYHMDGETVLEASPEKIMVNREKLAELRQMGFVVREY